MDVVLNGLDSMVLDGLWSKMQPEWERDNVYRQAISLYAITLVGVWILYFGIATFSYHVMFDKRMMKHPRFIKGQVKMEIAMASKGFPILDLMTLPWFLGECRGYSLMYEGIENSPFGHGRTGGIAYIILSAALFLWFTDFMIYLVHRVLHWPSVYKRLHKPHHKWVIPTPFSSHAFHPLDGYLQSLPYHMYVYMVPLHKYTYLGLFVVVNLWSIFIHDSDMIVGHPLENIINGPAHHTLHHMYFVYNYGQYFTWADKVGGSYRHPKTEDDPIHAIIRQEEAKEMYKREKEMLRLQEEQEKAVLVAAAQQKQQGHLSAAAPTIARTASESGHSACEEEGESSGRSEAGDEHSSSASEPEEAVTPFVEAAGMQLRSSGGGDVRERK